MGWRCITLECRGHGQSESGDHGRFSIRQFADDLVAFIENLQDGPLLVGGISMGAAIAMRVAAIRPDLVSGLVLARPAWIDQATPENLEPNREVARLLAAHAPAKALQHFTASPTAEFLKREAPDNLSSLIGFFDTARAAETQALLAAIASDGPGLGRDDIAGLDCPTLVIGHARDVIHPLDMAVRLAGLIPKARFVRITAKADDPQHYRRDFHNALASFMKEIGECR
jgi:pimeloyl-ACP methyl ester carboxylesterase